MLEATYDPTVFIEEKREGYVRYRNLEGRRWEVWGSCDYRGDCLIGSVIDGETVRDHAHLEEIKRRLGVERLVSEMDVPVSEDFNSCCASDGTLIIKPLPPGPPIRP